MGVRALVGCGMGMGARDGTKESLGLGRRAKGECKGTRKNKSW